MTAQTHDSLVGKWQWFYDRQRTAKPFGYSQSPVFEMGAEWLSDCETVADWGCGGGLLRNHVPAERYIGVDGSKTPAVDVVADLETYREPSGGVFMRNVLEHNHRWQRVLSNALAACRKRMVLAIYTPWHDSDEPVHEIKFEDAYGVPLLSFRQDAIEAELRNVKFEAHEVKSGSFYGVDHVYLIEKLPAR